MNAQAITQSKSVVLIDEHNLDKECIRLPSDYLQYAHLAADARMEVDRLKAKLEVTEAELGNRVRRRPGKYGLEKITEAGISDAVLQLPDYQTARSELDEARHNQEMLQAVVAALEHKKRSLTLLVELHGAGYFATPKISKEGKAAVEQMTKTKVRKSYREDDAL